MVFKFFFVQLISSILPSNLMPIQEQQEQGVYSKSLGHLHESFKLLSGDHEG